MNAAHSPTPPLPWPFPAPQLQTPASSRTRSFACACAARRPRGPAATAARAPASGACRGGVRCPTPRTSRVAAIKGWRDAWLTAVPGKGTCGAGEQGRQQAGCEQGSHLPGAASRRQPPAVPRRRRRRCPHRCPKPRHSGSHPLPRPRRPGTRQLHKCTPHARARPHRCTAPLQALHLPDAAVRPSLPPLQPQRRGGPAVPGRRLALWPTVALRALPAHPVCAEAGRMCRVHLIFNVC